MWSLATFVWADACSRLGLGDRAGEFYELLEPFSSQLAVTDASVWGRYPGPSVTSHHPGALRAGQGPLPAAAEIEERFGAPPWPRSAVAGTTASTTGVAWMRARRRPPLTLLDRTKPGRRVGPSARSRFPPKRASR